MSRVGVSEVGLQDAIHPGQALDRLPPLLSVLERVHEVDERPVRGLRDVGRRPELGKPPPPEVGMLGAVPDLAPQEELRRQLRSQGDPPGERPHHPLLGVAVVADAPGRRLHVEVAGERLARVQGAHRQSRR